MSKKKKHNKHIPKGLVIGLILVVVLAMLAAGFVLIKQLVTDDGHKRQRQIQKITLVKPPEPPKIKEKPPEPVHKKEKVIEQQQKEVPKPQEAKADNEPPPGDELGLDAEGSGSGDSFGLKARKGGRALIGGNGGGTGYGWYTKRIADELQQLVNKLVRDKGGIKEKGLKTEIRIKLDDVGRIVDFTIIGPSGNNELDNAVRLALTSAQLSDPPPYGMSRVLKFRIRPKG